MDCDSKIEEYRQRIHSLSSTGIDEDPSALLDAPHFDLELLEKESEEFLAKATKRINQLNVSPKSMGIINWLNQWKSKRKVDRIQVKFQTIVPKLQRTADDVKLWIQTLEERKVATIRQGEMLRESMGSMLDITAVNLDFYDELNNDCRQINYDVTKELAELKAAISFNAEMAHLCQSQKKRTSKPSRRSPRSEAFRSRSGEKKRYQQESHSKPDAEPSATTTSSDDVSDANKPKDDKQINHSDVYVANLREGSSVETAAVLGIRNGYSMSFEDDHSQCSDEIAAGTNSKATTNDENEVLDVEESAPFLVPMSPAVWHGYPRGVPRDGSPGPLLPASLSPFLCPPSSRSPHLCAAPNPSSIIYKRDPTASIVDSSLEHESCGAFVGDGLSLSRRDVVLVGAALLPTDATDLVAVEVSADAKYQPTLSNNNATAASTAIESGPLSAEGSEAYNGESRVRDGDAGEPTTPISSPSPTPRDVSDVGIESSKSSRSKGKKKLSKHSRDGGSKGPKEGSRGRSQESTEDREEWQGSEAKRLALQSKSVSLQSILQGQAQGQVGSQGQALGPGQSQQGQSQGQSGSASDGAAADQGERLSLSPPRSVPTSRLLPLSASLHALLGVNSFGTGGGSSLHCTQEDDIVHADLSSPHAAKAPEPTGINLSCSGGSACSCQGNGQNCNTHGNGNAGTGLSHRRPNSRDMGKLSRSGNSSGYLSHHGDSSTSGLAVLSKQYGSDPLLEVDDFHKQLMSRVEQCEAIKSSIPGVLHSVKVARDLELQSIKRAKKLRNDLDFICSGGAEAAAEAAAVREAARASGGGLSPVSVSSSDRRHSRDSVASSPDDSDGMVTADTPSSNGKEKEGMSSRFFPKDGDFTAGLLRLLSGSKGSGTGPKEAKQGATRTSWGNSGSGNGSSTPPIGQYSLNHRLVAASQPSQSPLTPSSASEGHLKIPRRHSSDHVSAASAAHHLHHYTHHGHHNHQNHHNYHSYHNHHSYHSHHGHHGHHGHHSHTISVQHLQQLSSEPLDLHGLDLSLLRTLSGSNLTPATESVCSASGSQSSGGNSIGDINSDSSSMHVVMELADDLVILLEEEARAREKLAIISALLDSASGIGTQLSKLEKFPSI